MTERAKVFHLSWWSDRLLAQAMSDPLFRVRLFRFVDAFPAMSSSADIDEHMRAEFAGIELPGWLSAGLGLSGKLPGGRRIPVSVARRTIARMARQFIIGTSPEEVAAKAGALWAGGLATTVDLLGEHTHSDREADAYAARMAGMVESLGHAARGWQDDPRLARDDLGPLARASVSVKLSALSPAFSPLSYSEALAAAERRLLPILERAGELGVSVWFDVERYETKALTQRIFEKLLSAPALAGLEAGIVVQAYLRDAANDLEDLIEFSRTRELPLGIRLVKGAYYDSETIEAAARGWASPLYSLKAHTDANYERLAARMVDAHGAIRPAFASHNIRSLAVAVAAARSRSLPDSSFELQLLYGMAEPVHKALTSLGLRVRLYAPMGELVPGMAYLVRRLLENTSNDSFVRHHFAEREDLEALLAPPPAADLAGPAPLAIRPQSTVRSPGAYRPEPPAEWHRAPVMAAFGAAVERELGEAPRMVPAVIAGEAVRTGHLLESVDPADPASRVAESVACGEREARQAVQAARAGADQWARTPAGERAALLFRVAEHLRRRRFELAALEVREAGKGWADADADVCEAIDYCEYYARSMIRLSAGGQVQSPPGEANRLLYRPRGVCAVIAPWNFPLAIPMGMTAASLVTGNSVILKPAEQTPAAGYEIYRAFASSGLPGGALQFLPGLGEVGAALASDPGVDLIAFTGSREVGLSILQAAARPDTRRRSIPRVVAELGGKNAVVVDADADLDEVVPAVISSAFGFAGQKCSAASRVICVGPIYDACLDRIVAATRSLVIDAPRRPGSQVGPVIDAPSRSRLLQAIARAPEAGEVLARRDDLPARGFFVGPTVVSEVDPGSWLANDELFGPVLAAFRAPDLEAALDMANSTDYALTAGVFSRSESHISWATEHLRAGNVYVNRAITGAVVGRQPFGGNGMSGVGSKAGGPDYLLQFCDPQVVSENTVRQGFAPTDGLEPR